MCGIVGVVAKNPVNQLLYDGLLVLQHRGQDAAGIVTAEGATFHMHKGAGHGARRVPHPQHARAAGHIGIAHTRYPTAGSAWSAAEAQPFYVNSPFGIVLGHNGNLTNSEQLKDELFRQDLRHVNTNSDSEVLLNVLAHELQENADQLQARPGDHLRGGVRRAPPLPRRLRGGGDDRRLRAARVPRSLRHPAAGVRARRDRAGLRVHGRLRERGAGRAGLRAGARRRARARRSSSTRTATFYSRQCAAERLAQPVHLRVRLPGAARFGDRRHLGLRDAAAHGREPRREDQAPVPPPRHRRGDPDPGFEPARRDGAGASV